MLSRPIDLKGLGLLYKDLIP
ncbi:MAG: hypothetical protein JCHSAcid_11740 [uncultured Acidilobus sp. JCHS]|nr:MAG: hypothetical protein JCHSAcid_11740 [uncultured Acidilobus sp. JCHS]